MATLFAGQEWSFVFVYLDDLLVVSRSIEEHVEHLGKVFRKLEEANLKLKPQKCKFAQEKIEYLGHTLTAEGVCHISYGIKAISYFVCSSVVIKFLPIQFCIHYMNKYVCTLKVCLVEVFTFREP